MTCSTGLRRIRTDDADAVARYCADRDLAWMTARIPHPYTIDMAEDFCAASQSPESRNWAVTEDGNFVGMTGYAQQGDAADIGYWIGAPFAGRGHATRAVRQLTGKIFDTSEFCRLTACVYQDNPASARVLLKAGFKQSADCEAESIARGPGTFPTWTFVLERAAWEAAR